jgi:hypothetical protein
VIGFGLQVRDNGRKTFTVTWTASGQTAAFRFGASKAAGPLSARLERFGVERNRLI